MNHLSTRTRRPLVVIAWALLCLLSHGLMGDWWGVRYELDGARPRAHAEDRDSIHWKSWPSNAGEVDLSGTDGTKGPLLRLTASASGDVSSLMHEVRVDRPGRLRLKAETRSIDLPTESVNRKGARLVLIPYNRDGEPLYDREHVVEVEHATTDWKSVQEVFRVQSDVASMRAGLMHFASTGTIEARSVELEWVQVRPEADALRWIFMVLWGLLGMRTLQRTWRQMAKLAPRIVTLGALFCLVGFALVPRDVVEVHVKRWASHQAMSVRTAPVVQKVESTTMLAGPAVAVAPTPVVERLERVEAKAPASDQPSPFSPWDGAHLVGFFVLTVLLRSGLTASAGQVFCQSMGVAVSIEVLQLFSPDRTPSWSDVGVDLVGTLLGLGLVAMFRRVVRRSSERP